VLVFGADAGEGAGGELVLVAVEVVEALAGLDEEDFEEVVVVGLFGSWGVDEGACEVAGGGAAGEEVFEAEGGHGINIA
jgi:hypothetical protein